MILIKLGGSIITDKSQYRTFNQECVSRLCKEIKRSNEEVIIVHGAGSFGHVLAKKHCLNEGYKSPDQIPAVAKVQYDVRDLNSKIIKELLDNDIPALSIPPGSNFLMENGKLIVKDSTLLTMLTDLGIMPVLFGDVVLDTERGFGICSGDQIMEVLCEIYSPEKVIFVSDIDGLYDKDPKTNKDAKLIDNVTTESLNNISSNLNVDDVTGGVRAKMESMLRISTKNRECILINGTISERLYLLLSGENVVSTTAKGSE